MPSAYTKSLIKTFVNLYGNDIIDAIADTGLFFATVVSQLSVESANGTSDLAVSANNFGGIKGNSSNGILMDTTEGNSRTPTRAWFKKYPNFREFINDYVDEIVNSPRYISAGVTISSSPEDQITAMVNAGYSTMTPKKYLAGGIKDRISACQDLYPKLARISSLAASEYKSEAGIFSECNPGCNTLWGMKLGDL